MKQEPETIGELLLEQLDILRQELHQLSRDIDSSGLERTNGLRNIMGKECEFYQKSLQLFLKKDFISIKSRILKCSDLFNQIGDISIE